MRLRIPVWDDQMARPLQPMVAKMAWTSPCRKSWCYQKRTELNGMIRGWLDHVHGSGTTVCGEKEGRYFGRIIPSAVTTRLGLINVSSASYLSGHFSDSPSSSASMMTDGTSNCNRLFVCDGNQGVIVWHSACAFHIRQPRGTIHSWTIFPGFVFPF